MKILQINSHYDQGGAARIVACIHRELLKEGADAYVAYGRGEKTNEKNVHMFGNGAGVYISAFLSRFTGYNGYFNPVATYKLLKIIGRIKPDVIHLHVLHGYYVNVPMLFKYINKHKIPCVWTFHDCHAFVGNCGYFFDCRKWEKGCESCPYIKNYPASLWFDRTEKMWREKKRLFTIGKKVIVSPSEWLAKEAKRSFFDRYECITIRNGIDTKGTFYPRDKYACRKKYGYEETQKLILGIAVGYRDERKGAKYILDLAKKLQGEAKIILVGWNRENDGLLDGIFNVITLENTKDKDMLAEYYSMADVFVIPSLAENYATTTLEAMACGTPVVGFAVGGIPEQVRGNKGIVVKAGNEEAFIEAVSRILKNPDCVLNGERLAQTVQEENSIEQMVKEYKRVYEKVLREERLGE